MNNYNQVDQLLNNWYRIGMSKAEIVWEVAKACIGWPYVFGAWGELCTPANRRNRYKAAHPTIKTACKGYSSGDCQGCKWYPDEIRVRMFDCRGFTYWCLHQVGIDLDGQGATSQWNTESNWSAKGEIKEMPADTLVCLFVKKGNTMEHTGFGYNGESCECSSGVQYFQQRKNKWTHWAIPKGLNGTIPPTDAKPVLKRGDKGPYVREVQFDLINRGYDLGKWGADGDFGKQTEKAVKAFQADNGIAVDGIVGPATYEALGKDPVKYTVHIPNLSEVQAKKLLNEYPGSWEETEG
jgi:hypothetical protein